MSHIPNPSLYPGKFQRRHRGVQLYYNDMIVTLEYRDNAGKLHTQFIDIDDANHRQTEITKDDILVWARKYIDNHFLPNL